MKANPCVHHWLIEPCTGLTSRGICRKCGKEREFENYLPNDFSTPMRPWKRLNEFERLIDGMAVGHREP